MFSESYSKFKYSFPLPFFSFRFSLPLYCLENNSFRIGIKDNNLALFLTFIVFPLSYQLLSYPQNSFIYPPMFFFRATCQTCLELDIYCHLSFCSTSMLNLNSPSLLDAFFQVLLKWHFFSQNLSYLALVKIKFFVLCSLITFCLHPYYSIISL